MNSNGSLTCQCIKEYEGDFCTIGIIIKDSFLEIISVKILFHWVLMRTLTSILNFLDKCLDVTGTYKCLYGGTCAVSKEGEAFCNCLDQYEGKMCELGKHSKIMNHFTIYSQCL